MERRIKAPDPDRDEHFTQMVSTYQTPLLRLCCYCLMDRNLAEDAVQETFIKAYQAMDQFRGDSSEKTWLSHIAMNVCHDMQRTAWFRHASRRISLDALPELSVELPEDVLALHQALSQLPRRLREVILLYYYQNLTVSEIAEVLSLRQSSVSGRLKRARDKLSKLLKGGAFNA